MDSKNTLRCLCKQRETKELKVEGDLGADPIWCNRCNCNLEIEEVPISLDLKSELIHWMGKYGEWIDWDNDDEIVPNGIKFEDEHNKQGLELTNKLQKELGGDYVVIFSPSSFARRNACK
ncbi:hypothetical protein [Gracilibacillus kekensis]|uniref:Uncharacterized protein n=1 Tax=Gracilibacillus kekensis TaxID=1027249 RepID=A0A1M7IWQ6_9BACI|nr:hypothetical protein [Gracilibacillus kekensis]SHM45172.1 hypothetical protein SAMN05216179_0178 [Gracilibacillus kekensis]